MEKNMKTKIYNFKNQYDENNRFSHTNYRIFHYDNRNASFCFNDGKPVDLYLVI